MKEKIGENKLNFLSRVLIMDILFVDDNILQVIFGR